MAQTFDFDEWTELHHRDPAAFEARREAVLALELARASPAGAIRAKAALQALERQMTGCEEAQRLETSMLWMAASMRELSDSLTDLGALALTSVADLSARRSGLRCPTAAGVSAQPVAPGQLDE